MIAERIGIDSEELEREFEACAGTGEETQSPGLCLVGKIAPEFQNDRDSET